MSSWSVELVHDHRVYLGCVLCFSAQTIKNYRRGFVILMKKSESATFNPHDLSKL